MIPLIGSVLVASLLGSPHCAGMCGGFVTFYAGGDGRGRVMPHLAYNGGRLISYVTPGVIAGALGAGGDHMGALAGPGRGAGLLAGGGVVVWGASALLAEAGVAIRLPAAPAALKRPLTGALKAVHARPAPVRALVMGLVTTLLPCGWLYAFVALAGGTAHPLAGALVMAVFWMGTLPVMAGLGLAAQTAFGPLRRRLPVFTATLLVVFGLLTVADRFRPMPMMHHLMPGMTMPSTGGPPAQHEHH
jgi:uncharacterized protein